MSSWSAWRGGVGTMQLQPQSLKLIVSSCSTFDVNTCVKIAAQ